MLEKIKNHIGHYYTFRLDGMIMSGFFCGIGKLNDDCGMVFLISNDAKNVSDVVCLFVHPLKIKCTLHNNRILDLRRICRKYFKKQKMHNKLDNIYSPIFKIEKIKEDKIKCQ